MCSLIMVANARSNSSESRTATRSSFMPNVCTAIRDSASWAGWEALSGFQRRATCETEGTTSLRSCSRLPTTSGPRMVFPVMLPPGLLMLATSPAPTGSPIAIMTMGIVVVALLGCLRLRRTERRDEVHPAVDQLCRGLREPRGQTVSIAIFKGDVLTFLITNVAQSLPERVPGRRVIDDANTRNPRSLLRARRERPRRRAEERDELTPLDAGHGDFLPGRVASAPPGRQATTPGLPHPQPAAEH